MRGWLLNLVRCRTVSPGASWPGSPSHTEDDEGEPPVNEPEVRCQRIRFHRRSHAAVTERWGSSLEIEMHGGVLIELPPMPTACRVQRWDALGWVGWTQAWPPNLNRVRVLMGMPR